MDIQTLLQQHANGFYDSAFETRWGSGNAMTGYAIHSTDLPDSIYTTKLASGACHASINSILNRDTALAVITMADRTLTDNPGAVQFYDWLINKSFFSDVFLCKDPVLSLRHGFVKRLDISAAKWLGAAQMSRLSTSEFKVHMKAVYDILASGFDIHPMFLTLLSTELGFVSNGKTIQVSKPRRIDDIASCLYSNNSSHLPLVYCNSTRILKEICKDDCNKDFSFDFNYRHTFKEQRWPIHSNVILCKESRNGDGGYNDQPLVEALKSLTKGSASLLFNIEMVEVPYTSLWDEAIIDLKSFICSSAKGATMTLSNLPINLSGIEQLSKTLKLGQ